MTPASGLLEAITVAIHCKEGQLLCEHRRIIERSHKGPGRTVYDWRHYLAVIQRKPGALRNGAPFAELPDAFRQLQGQLLKRPGGDREMVEILAARMLGDHHAILTQHDAVGISLDLDRPANSTRGNGI